MGKVLGIIAIKGGVGKTTTVANLGVILSKEHNKQVLIIDANFSAPNLGLHFGLTNPKKTLHDVLLNRSDMEDAIIKQSDNFHILPSAFLSRKVNPFKLKQKIDKIRDNYDIILIDSSPALNEEILATMIASDELLTVTSPDYPTLSTTLRAVRLAKQKNTLITGLIVNKVRNKKFELTVQDIEKTAETPVLAVVPDDIKIQQAVSLTSPASSYFTNSNAVVEYKKLAAALIGEKYVDTRFSYRMKKLFSGKLPKEEINREVLRVK
jgi:MinD-like ATPase involved in chromosome partitioning or flagellar assembly